MSNSKSKLFAIVLAGLALTGTSLFAGALKPVVATLKTPLTAARANIVAADAVWQCTTTECTTNLDRKKPIVGDCRAIARIAGQVSSFKVGDQELDEAGLNACNRGMR